MKAKSIISNETTIGVEDDVLISIAHLERLKKEDCLNVVQEMVDKDIKVFGLRRFNYGPFTGEKIDWDALKKRYSNE